MPLTQLPPSSKLLLLLALTWSARLAIAPEMRTRLRSTAKRLTRELAGNCFILCRISYAAAPRRGARPAPARRPEAITQQDFSCYASRYDYRRTCKECR